LKNWGHESRKRRLECKETLARDAKNRVSRNKIRVEGLTEGQRGEGERRREREDEKREREGGSEREGKSEKRSVPAWVAARKLVEG